MKKIFIVVWSIAIASLLYISFSGVKTGGIAPAATFRYGSRGDTVREIQRRLKNWGYYTGTVDGVYGSKTVAAVKYFQGKNGLTPDGIAGAATLKALGINVSKTATAAAGSQNEALLARLISGEARGEPYIGQVAVAAVVINRTRDPRFPTTIAGVIYQPGAFTAVSDGQISVPPDANCVKAARDALNGWDPSGGAVFYYNPAKTTNKWIWSRPIIKRIGSHIFCK